MRPAGWAWLVVGADPLPGACTQARATPEQGYDAGPAGEVAPVWLQSFPAGPRPAETAVRVDRRVLDRQGAPARVSLVLLPEGRCPLFDDPAVSQALRDVLTGPAVDAVTTLTRDAVHWAGALSVVRDARDLSGDPFRRLGTARVLAVDEGLLGRAPITIAPVTQRYGGQPWPAARFPDAVIG